MLPHIVVVMAISCGALRERAAVGEDTVRETASQCAGCVRVHTVVLRDLTSGHFEDCKRKKKSVEKRIKESVQSRE